MFAITGFYPGTLEYDFATWLGANDWCRISLIVIAVAVLVYTSLARKDW